MISVYSKKELQKKVKWVSCHEFRNEINEIIAANRNLPLEKAKYKRFLWPKEVILFLKQYDIKIEDLNLTKSTQ